MSTTDDRRPTLFVSACMLTVAAFVLIAAAVLLGNASLSRQSLTRISVESSRLRTQHAKNATRSIHALADRITRTSRTPEDAPVELVQAVEALSVRQAAQLAEMLWERAQIDPRPWLKLPHAREQAAAARLADLQKRFGSGEPGYPRLEQTVRGSALLRKLCGDEVLTETIGVGIWRFAEGIPIPSSFNDDDMKIILGLRGLEWFTAESSELTDSGVARLATLPHLREVRIAGTKVSDQSLRALGRLPNLRVLDVSYAANITDVGIAALADCRRLTELKLERTKVSSASLPTIARFRKLRELSLSETPVVTGLSQLRVLRALEQLGLAQLGSHDQQVPSESLAFLSELKSLKALALKGTAVKTIALNGLPDLSRLTLGHESLQDVTLTDLPEIHTLSIYSDYGKAPLLLKQLRIRGLSACRQLNVQGLNRPAAGGLARGIATMPNLYSLNLNGEMTDSLALAIGKLEQLQSLVMRHVFVTEAQLSSIARAPELARVHVGGEKLTSAGLAGLRMAVKLNYVLIDDAHLENLDFLRETTSIRALQLNRCVIDEIRLGEADRLQVLDIREGEFGLLTASDSTQFVRLSMLQAECGRLEIANCPSFRSLFCGSNCDFQNFQLNDLPSLESMTIQEGARPGTMQLDNLPALKRVSYWAAEIDASHIKALQDLTGLRHLDVSGTQLADDGASAISELITLESVGASGAFGIEGLRKIAMLPKLHDLNLYHGEKSDWTPQQARELFSHVREVTVF